MRYAAKPSPTAHGILLKLLVQILYGCRNLVKLAVAAALHLYITFTPCKLLQCSTYTIYELYVAGAYDPCSDQCYHKAHWNGHQYTPETGVEDILGIGVGPWGICQQVYYEKVLPFERQGYGANYVIGVYCSWKDKICLVLAVRGFSFHYHEAVCIAG